MAKPMNPDKPKPYSMIAEIPRAAHAMGLLADIAAMRGSVEELRAIKEIQKGIHQLLGRVRKLETEKKAGPGEGTQPRYVEPTVDAQLIRS